MKATLGTRVNALAISARLHASYPDKQLPWGALSVIAREMHFSREYVRQIAKKEAFHVQHA